MEEWKNGAALLSVVNLSLAGVKHEPDDSLRCFGMDRCSRAACGVEVCLSHGRMSSLYFALTGHLGVVGRGFRSDDVERDLEENQKGDRSHTDTAELTRAYSQIDFFVRNWRKMTVSNNEYSNGNCPRKITTRRIYPPGGQLLGRRKPCAPTQHAQACPGGGRSAADSSWSLLSGQPPSLERLREKIESVNWEQARRDVLRFVKTIERPSLDLWSEEFFMGQCEKL